VLLGSCLKFGRASAAASVIWLAKFKHASLGSSTTPISLVILLTSFGYVINNYMSYVISKDGKNKFYLRNQPKGLE
jgi:hypothetical protein